MPKKKKPGRPTKYKGISSTIVRKLSEAFKQDFNIEEACAYANISKDTYYRWIKENKGFSDEMEVSKKFSFIAAKKVVFQAMRKGNLKAAQWLLERRQRSVYGNELQATEPQQGEKPLGEKEMEGIMNCIEMNRRCQDSSHLES